MKSVFIGHPGPYGDIIVCAPIAKNYFDRGYKVYWPARAEYLDLLSRFDYVNPVPLPDLLLVNQFGDEENRNMSDILMGQNICSTMEDSIYLHVGDRFVDGKYPFATPRINGETIMEKKYRISGVDFIENYNLVWTRDVKKEQELYELVVKEEKYVFAHLSSSRGGRVDLPLAENLSVVEPYIIPGYSILDWFKVIQNAERIYCTESSFQCFVDGMSTYTKAGKEERFLLNVYDKGTHWTNHRLSNNYWNKKYIEGVG